MRGIRRRRNDNGVLLIIILIFTTCLMLVIAAVLSYASTSDGVRARVYRTVASDRTSADGALSWAVSKLRLDDNAASGGCESLAVPANVAPNVTVTCTPYSGSAQVTTSTTPTTSLSPSTITSLSPSPTTVPVTCVGTWTDCPNANNTPVNAVLTLATGSEDGFVQSSNHVLSIVGPVVSNSSILVPAGNGGGQMAVTYGSVYARGNCDSAYITVTSGYARQCNQATIPNSADPGYPLPGTMPTSAGTISGCTNTGRFVVFSPGIYNSAATLSSVFGASSTCKGTTAASSVFWFQPGVYYFDFTDAAAAHQWVINNKDDMLIAGQPKGWAPVSAGAAAPSASFPGGCKADEDGATDGVEFVFGGDSSITLQAGSVEMCAQPSSTTQEISVFGMPSTVGIYRAESGCITASPYPSTAPATPAACSSASTPTPLLSTRGNQSKMSIHGGLYAPRAALDLQLTNSNSQTIERGLVARAVRANVTSSSSFTGDLFKIVAESVTPSPTWTPVPVTTVTPVPVPTTTTVNHQADRVVTLTAVVNGVPVLEERVRFTDNDGSLLGTTASVLEYRTLR